MARFLESMAIGAETRILDVGGKVAFWADVEIPLNITMLNLTREGWNVATHHRITYVEGDGCDLSRFKEREFDVAFSNSVIEHVGPRERQDAFARELRRVGKAYWIQTPSIWAPIEAHTALPFWWFYPAPLREAVLSRWRRELPAFCEMVEGTRVLSMKRMRSLFPEADIWTERLAGIPKSYSLYCVPAEVRRMREATPSRGGRHLQLSRTEPEPRAEPPVVAGSAVSSEMPCTVER